MSTPDIADVAHDTKNIRASLNALPNVLKSGDHAPSRVAIIGVGVATALIASVAGAGLIWGVNQVSKVPAMEERVANLNTQQDRLLELVQALRQTAVSAAGATALREAEIAALNLRLTTSDQARTEMDRGIINRVDRDLALIRDLIAQNTNGMNHIREQMVQNERRLADLMISRRSFFSAPQSEPITPYLPETALTPTKRLPEDSHGNRY